MQQEAHPQATVDSVTMKRFTLGGTDFGAWQLDIWDASLPKRVMSLRWSVEPHRIAVALPREPSHRPARQGSAEACH